MKHLMLTTMLGVTALLAACGQKTESNETTAANSATEAASNKGEMSGDMGNMAMPADSAAKMAKGNGTVTGRKSVVEGKSVSVRVDLGGRRISTKKNTQNTERAHHQNQ